MIALDISTFFGRFHPLFVHLPIGFLLLAIIIEWYQGKKKASKDNRYIAFAWLLGAISAIVAAICGWLLADTGNYSEEDIFWHRWLGVVLAVVASLGWWIKTKPKKFSKVANNAVGMLVVGLLLIEGHLGGNLTHGADYLLEYAPESVQRLFGGGEQDDALPQLIDKDSVLVYNDMVYPILEAKCVSCHNDGEQRGGLNMVQTELLMEGGENGPVVAPGNTQESELFRRVTLSQKNEKFMPPKGEPLTYNEIKVLEWWINNGGDVAKPLPEHEIGPQMQTVLLKLYGLDTAPKPWYESVRIEAADSLELVNLEQAGFTVKTLGQENPLLDVKYSGEDLSQEQLAKLEAVSEHITWLSLAKTNVEDDWLATVGKFPNLTRLQLEKTAISDAGLTHISKLEHLEALNLYGTKITDAGLEALKIMPALRRVYLWGTSVSSAAASQLQEASEELEVIGGVTAN
ncbi:MAG: c-type cytochrome domain-containing protein [Flavobacteriaceae bacterium]